uniref:Uncharacterized protein n=1 Tax=Nelumbo nucifera TaxID=4432 RepID=A0A822Y5L3_NELNU|nr:TPA_asm: hypothetical protein HUJ06_028087 [Nelumbo nucifera]
MERGSSTQSLSSRGGSDMGSSRYLIESGFYLTSLAATIFVAALITVGVLFITLLVALTLMLQSCQSRNSGVVQLRETRVEYDYCKSFTLHAELNNLEVAEFPTICKAHAISYIKEDLANMMGVL